MNSTDITRFRGWVALGLTATLAIGVLGIIAIALLQGFSNDLGTILSLVLGGLVSGLGVYLGMQAKQGQQPAEQPAPTVELPTAEHVPDPEWRYESLGLDAPEPVAAAAGLDAGDAPDAPDAYVGVDADLRGEPQ